MAATTTPKTNRKSSAAAKAAVKPQPKKTPAPRKARGSAAAGRKITEARRVADENKRIALAEKKADEQAVAREGNGTAVVADAVAEAVKACTPDPRRATEAARTLAAPTVVPGLKGKALQAWIETGESSGQQAQKAAQARKAAERQAASEKGAATGRKRNGKVSVNEALLAALLAADAPQTAADLAPAVSEARGVPTTPGAVQGALRWNAIGNGHGEFCQHAPGKKADTGKSQKWQPTAAARKAAA